MEMTMKLHRMFWILVAPMLFSACASSVNLDTVPVEDKKGADVASMRSDAGKADADALAKRSVAPVDLGKSASDTAPLPLSSRTVYFDYDSFVIRPEFQSVIEKQAAYLKSDKKRRVGLEGHTDERGGREYNISLGQKRAESVRRSLGLLGVSEDQMEAVSFGKEKPAARGDSEEAMAKNRRTEFTYR